MFNKGDYVRLRRAPNTRVGTIEGSKTERGQVQYLFRQDKRVVTEKDTPDFYMPEGELERCARPTDPEIETINRLIQRGS